MNSRMLPFFALALVACGGGAPASSSPDQPVADTGALEGGGSDPGDDVRKLPSAPADLLFVLDRSASWSRRSDRFEGMKAAVKSFVTAHEGRYAATVFPRATGDACDNASYATLDLAFPASAVSIGSLFDAVTFGGDSALGPALGGLAAPARAHAALDPRRSTSIVLLTDATPGDDEACVPSGFPEIALRAGEIFDRGRLGSARVNVLSVMGTAVSEAHFGLLGDIAAKGGGYAAFVNGSREDVESSTRDALEDMRDRAETCTRVVPEGMHPESLAIAFPDGSTLEAPRVADASACAGAGFYLDDPEHPKTASLCGGMAGVGGFCEATFVRARMLGAPRVTAR
jgi:hypothetical protein